MATQDRAQLRVGYAEREETVRQIAEAHSLGQLDTDEFEERVAVAQSAKTQSDLDALVADLPGAQRKVRAPQLRPERSAARPCGKPAFWRIAGLVALVWLAVTLVVGMFHGMGMHGRDHDGPPVFLFVALGIGAFIFIKRRRCRANQ